MIVVTLLLVGCGGPTEETGRAVAGPDVQVTLPVRPGALDDLVATVAVADGGDVSLAYAWQLDGIDAGHAEPYVPSALLDVGQTWTVTVTAERGGHQAVSSATTTIDHLGGNVLIVIVDDLGVDKVAAYGVHPQAPPTPTIDGLAQDGVLFRNAWANPTCSPSRASLFTGRHARRNGVGRWIYPWEQAIGIMPDEVMLPELIRTAPVAYADALVGKWHLSGYVGNDDPGMDPLIAGWSWFAGTLANPDNSYLDAGGVPKGYTHWEKATNGDLAWEDDYLTTVTTDDALDRVRAMPEPWLLVVSYNAPHIPLHVPPAELYGGGLDPLTATDIEMYDAMAMALDTELGRLLDGVPPDVMARTTTMFIGDNGTPSRSILEPLDPTRCKGTVYEGGVNVPFIVTGPAVREPGTESEALIHLVDVFPTVAELTGADPNATADPRTGLPPRIEGVSFLPVVRDPAQRVQDRLYTTQFYPNGPPPYAIEQDALRDDRYKVVWDPLRGWLMFEYVAPFDEGPELFELGPLTDDQQAAFDVMSVDLTAEIEARTFGP